MEYAALISFALLIVSWMALPAGGRVLGETVPAIRAQAVGAEA